MPSWVNADSAGRSAGDACSLRYADFPTDTASAATVASSITRACPANWSWLYHDVPTPRSAAAALVIAPPRNIRRYPCRRSTRCHRSAPTTSAALVTPTIADRLPRSS